VIRRIAITASSPWVFAAYWGGWAGSGAGPVAA
jgi:hypothetical protein